MNDRMKFVLQFVDERRANAFTGAVKFGVEKGMLVSVGEANVYESVSYTDKSIDNNELIAIMASSFKASFNGTFVFRFVDGNIDGYAYSRTYKGDELKRLIGLN